MTISLAELRAALDVYVHQCDEQSGRIFTGRVSPEGARVFVQQWGLFTRHSRQCWANVVGNCPVVEARRFMVKENLLSEWYSCGHSPPGLGESVVLELP